MTARSRGEPGAAGGLGCGGHHGWAACGVDGQQGGSGLGCGADSSGDGVGDVVEFEIEEDVEAAVAEGLDEAVAGGVVKLHAHLEPETASGEAVYEFERGFGGWEVEGYGEAVFWLGGRGCWLNVPRNQSNWRGEGIHSHVRESGHGAPG